MITGRKSRTEKIRVTGPLGERIEAKYSIFDGTAVIEMAGADLVITGEGKIDGQTMMGKTPAGVAELAKRHGVPVYAFAGVIDESGKR